jgi:tetratricopeptide (TPR) repeat protein
LLERVGQSDRALELYRRNVELVPDDSEAHFTVARLAHERGDEDEARAQDLDGLRRELVAPAVLASLERTLASEGHDGLFRRRAMNRLAELNGKLDRHEDVSPLLRARLYATLGRNDEAFACLNQAYDRRLPQLATLKVDQALMPLQSDPRFKELLRRMRLPE